MTLWIALLTGTTAVVLAIAMLPTTRALCELSEASVLRSLWIWIDGLIFVAGLAALALCRRPIGAKLGLASFCLVGVGLGAGEAFLRGAIFLGVERVRDPSLYAGWHHDEDHWKLRHLWLDAPGPRQLGFSVHSLLGWTRPDAPGPGTIPDHESSILVYGDSFTQGVAPAPVERRIPGLLDLLFPERAVRDYATSGYGIDQIYLSLRESHAAYADSAWVVGLLTLDIDRAIFSVRDAPKPRFRIESGELALENVPIPEDTDSWYAAHPPAIRSYLLSLVTRQLRLATGGPFETEFGYRREEKVRIGTAILESIVDLARDRGAPLVFVIFYGEWELGYEGWREVFLKQLFAQLAVPFVDTRAVFARELSERGSPVSDFYYRPPNGHLNERGNRVVAEAIADRLRSHAAARSSTPSM